MSSLFRMRSRRRRTEGLTERDDRHHHGNPRTGPILLDRPSRHVQMHVQRREHILARFARDAEVERVRADPGKGDLGGFGDDIAE